MRGLAILLGFNLLGALLQEARVPLPGNVIGLILFTACLFLGIVKLQWVEESAHFLLRHMLLFFAPAVVGAIPLFGRFRGDWRVFYGLPRRRIGCAILPKPRYDRPWSAAI